MDLQPPFVTPDRNRNPFFDGAQEETAALSFVCQGCGKSVTLNVLQFVSNANSWFRALAEQDRCKLSNSSVVRSANMTGTRLLSLMTAVSRTLVLALVAHAAPVTCYT